MFRVASARYVGTFGGVELRFLRQKHARRLPSPFLTFTRLHRWRGAHGQKCVVPRSPARLIPHFLHGSL